MKQLLVKIVTPDKEVVSQTADALVCPTTTGQIEILPGHVPIVSDLEHGELVLKVAGKPDQHFSVSSGFLEVKPHTDGEQTSVVILANTAEHSDAIDAERAAKAVKDAQAIMAAHKSGAQKLSDEEYQAAASAFQKNIIRGRVAKRAHRGKHGVGSEGVFKE